MLRALTVSVLLVGLATACSSTSRSPDEPPVRVDARAELNAADPLRIAQAHCAIAGKRAVPATKADGAISFTCVD